MHQSLARILIVDDIQMNTVLMRKMLAEYECETAAGGAEALSQMVSFRPDLVLLDVVMPEMDGFEVCRRIKTDPAHQSVSVVLLTALNDRESRIKGLAAGADEFLTKPVDPTELKLRTRNLLKGKEYQDFLARHNQILQEKVEQRTHELEAAYGETIARLSIAAEFKDIDTGLHISRISHFSKLLAELLGLPATEQELIAAASPMHDIGKLGVPDGILLKPAPLTQAEFMIMQTHTTIGGRILEKATAKLLRIAQTIALYHHERWDGSGYPHGVAGENCPLEARIVNIVVQYDALRSQRPYKTAFSHETALSILSAGDGRTMPGHFDPQILQAFLQHHHRFAEIYESLK